MAFEVFISWSGVRSKEVARALTVWLKEVIQSVDTLMNEQIPGGAPSFVALSKMLTQAEFGVIVVTPENWATTWINYEPGVIVGKGAQVCPYLIDLSRQRGELPVPLSFFQARTATRDGTYELVKDINAAAGSPLTELQLQRSFNGKWRRLEKVIAKINKDGPPPPPPRPPDPKDCSDDFMRVSGYIKCHQDTLYGRFHDLIYKTADAAKAGRYTREQVIRLAREEIEKSKASFSDKDSLLVGNVADFFAKNFKLVQLVDTIKAMEKEMRPEDFDERRRYIGDLSELQRRWFAYMKAVVSDVFFLFHRTLVEKLGECQKRAGSG